MNQYENNSLIDEVNCDLDGFIDAGAEDCEERFYTLDGKEITDGSDAK